MRTYLASTLLILLSACDGGGPVDQSIQQGVRQSAIQACIAWVPSFEMAEAAGLNGERLCTCAADRLLAGKSMADLAQGIRPDSPENRRAIVQCIADIQGSTPAVDAT
jgi:hypothetical protein